MTCKHLTTGPRAPEKPAPIRPDVCADGFTSGELLAFALIWAVSFFTVGTLFGLELAAAVLP